MPTRGGRDRSEPELEIKNSKDLIREFMKLKESVEFMSEKFEENNKQNEELKKLLIEFKKENQTLKEKVVEMEARCSELEQEGLTKNLILNGIPKQSDNEDIEEIVKKVAKGINYQINSEDITEAYRRGKDAGPIIIKFKNEQIKNNLIEKRKEVKSIKVNECNLKGNNNVIYINEHLTPYLNKLFYDARQLRQSGFKFVWAKQGKIFVRKDENAKIVPIRSNKDIDNLN